MIQLKEMPYINYGNHEIIDLQLEDFKGKPEELLDLIMSILKGKEYRDKYDNLIKLTSEKEKKDFIKALQNNPYFYNFIKKDFTRIEEKLLTFLFDFFK